MHRFPRAAAAAAAALALIPLMVTDLDAQPTAGGSPTQVIQALYAAHQPWRNKEIDLCDGKTLDAFFHPTIAGLLVKECECRRKTQETCAIDWDPFYDAQDFAEKVPVPAIRRREPPNGHEFIVTLTNFSDVRLVYDMTQLAGQWRIANIRSPRNQWSLKQLLSAPH
jgi:hypothetical protein